MIRRSRMLPSEDKPVLEVSGKFRRRPFAQ